MHTGRQMPALHQVLLHDGAMSTPRPVAPHGSPFCTRYRHTDIPPSEPGPHHASCAQSSDDAQGIPTDAAVIAHMPVVPPSGVAHEPLEQLAATTHDEPGAPPPAIAAQAALDDSGSATP